MKDSRLHRLRRVEKGFQDVCHPCCYCRAGKWQQTQWGCSGDQLAWGEERGACCHLNFLYSPSEIPAFSSHRFAHRELGGYKCKQPLLKKTKAKLKCFAHLVMDAMCVPLV